MATKSLFDGSKWDSQFFTAKDALTPRPPTCYLIDGLIPIPSLSIFYGLPASYKTNLVIDGLVCVSLGATWLAGEDFRGFGTLKKPILWIDADSGIDILHERFAASLRSHGKTQSQQVAAPIHYASFLDPAFCVTDDASVTELIRRAKLLDSGAIVFDNLGTISGGVDENSPLMIPLMSRLRQIASRARVAVILIHHIVKHEQKNHRSTPRGHGSIEAALDFAFHVSADDNLVTIENTKSRRARQPTFSALFEYEHKPNTQDLLKMNFLGMKPELPAEYVTARRALLTFFEKNNQANQGELVSVIKSKKIGDNKARAILHTLTRSNFLALKSGQARNQNIYKLGNKDAEIILV